MTFLIFTIILSTLNHLLFRVFARFRINLLSAIVSNYAVCVVIGFSSSVESTEIAAMFGQNWYPLSVLQGGIFVACFFLIGWTTKKNGVAIASLSTRLSVAIPTFLAFFLYDDSVTALKFIGILTALFALFLTAFEFNVRSYRRQTIHIYPFFLFIVFGIHATLVKYVQEHFLGSTSFHIYVMASFLSAFVISGMVLLWRIIHQQHPGKRKDLLFGIILGFTNYGAIYFLLKALSVPGWQSSQLFPTISIAVVSLSSISAWAVFKERLNRKIIGAIMIGVGSIVLINL